MDLNEKAAYIKGLAEGLELDADAKEGKIINQLICLVSDMAEEIAELRSEVDTLNDYVDEIDEDLGEVEEVLCGEGGLCRSRGKNDHFCRLNDGDSCCRFGDDEEITDEFTETECPSCGEKIFMETDMLEPDVPIICPNCKNEFKA